MATGGQSVYVTYDAMYTLVYIVVGVVSARRLGYL
jgi:hypothetical protein